MDRCLQGDTYERKMSVIAAPFIANRGFRFPFEQSHALIPRCGKSNIRTPSDQNRRLSICERHVMSDGGQSSKASPTTNFTPHAASVKSFSNSTDANLAQSVTMIPTAQSHRAN